MMKGMADALILLGSYLAYIDEDDCQANEENQCLLLAALQGEAVLLGTVFLGQVVKEAGQNYLNSINHQAFCPHSRDITIFSTACPGLTLGSPLIDRLKTVYPHFVFFVHFLQLN
jgi:hypothetical protein